MQQYDLLLEVNNLKTHFFVEEGTVRAVDGVTFQVRQGRTLGVLGESGCGKSVMGFSILQLVRPPGKIIEGEILYHRVRSNQGDTPPAAEVVNLVEYDPFGEDIRKIRGAEIAMVFQEPMTALDPLYTVGDQIIEAVTLHQKVSKQVARTKAIEMLDQVGMPNPQETVDKYPHQLSGGMRQRVMIAMALSCQPHLLIADEPTTALDVTTEAQILELMADLQRDLNMAMLFITHDLGVIAEIAQDVIVMYLGKVVEHTDVHTLFNNPKHPYTQALMRSIPRMEQKRETRLQAIKGMVPTLHDIPSGCAFNPRCPSFMPGVCDTAAPELREVETGHFVSCFLYDETHNADEDQSQGSSHDDNP